MMLVGMEAQFGSRNEVIADTPKLIPVANRKFYLNTFFFGGEESGNVIMLWLFR